MGIADLDRRLAVMNSGTEMRELYASAYLEVRRLIMTEGEPAVWRRVMSNKN